MKKVLSIINDNLIIGDGFSISYINPLIWKIFDRMKKDDVGYIVPLIYTRYKYSHRLPKKFITTAIQKYGVVGDKLMCKYMFGRTCFKQFSLSKLFWEFSHFDPCNDKFGNKYNIDYGSVFPDTVHDIFYMNIKGRNEMRNFMWRINNINLSIDHYHRLIRLYEQYIDKLEEKYRNDMRIPIFKEIISFLQAKITQLENRV
jgi:hypothetical protein